MADLKTALTKVVNRRRLAGGEFSYVFRPTGESVTGKKAVWGMVKADKEAYNKLREEALVEGEADSVFDTRALKMIPLVGYEGEVKDEVTDMDTGTAERSEGGAPMEILPFDEFFRKVTVDKFDKKSSAEEIETFLRQFENVGLIKRRMVSSSKKGNNKEIFSGCYDVTFTDNESAAKFLALPEVKFKDKVLNIKLRKTLMQERTLQRMQNSIFSHNKRITECLAKTGEEGKQVFVFGIGKDRGVVINPHNFYCL